MEQTCRAFYDPRCEELARQLLADAPEPSETDALELAGVIQRAIEGWWASRRPTTDWQDPDLPAPANPLKKE